MSYVIHTVQLSTVNIFSNKGTSWCNIHNPYKKSTYFARQVPSTGSSYNKVTIRPYNIYFVHGFKLILPTVSRMAHTPLLEQLPEDDTMVSKYVGVLIRAIYTVSWSAFVGKYVVGLYQNAQSAKLNQYFNTAGYSCAM